MKPEAPAASPVEKKAMPAPAGNPPGSAKVNTPTAMANDDRRRTATSAQET